MFVQPSDCLQDFFFPRITLTDPIWKLPPAHQKTTSRLSQNNLLSCQCVPQGSVLSPVLFSSLFALKHPTNELKSFLIQNNWVVLQHFGNKSHSKNVLFFRSFLSRFTFAFAFHRLRSLILLSISVPLISPCLLLPPSSSLSSSSFLPADSQLRALACEEPPRLGRKSGESV